MAKAVKKSSIKKAQDGIMSKVAKGIASYKQAGKDIEKAKSNYKTADSLSKAKPDLKKLGFEKFNSENKSNMAKADSLRKAGRKLEGLPERNYKTGGKVAKKSAKKK